MAHDPDSIQSRVDLQSRYSSVNLPQWLRTHIDLPLEGFLLDLGCADGRFTNQVLQSKPVGCYVGLDQSVDSLRVALLKTLEHLPDDTSFLRADFDRTLPFAADTFDTTFAFFSIYYANSLRSLCEELCRILRPDGTLIAVGPAPGNKDNLYELIQRVCPEFEPLALPAESFLSDLYVALEPLDADLETETVVYDIVYPDTEQLRAYLEATMIPSRPGWRFLQERNRWDVLNTIVSQAFERGQRDEFDIDRVTSIVEVTFSQ